MYIIGFKDGKIPCRRENHPSGIRGIKSDDCKTITAAAKDFKKMNNFDEVYVLSSFKSNNSFESCLKLSEYVKKHGKKIN